MSSNITINLLPDIRQQKERNRQRKQLFTSVVIVVWIVCGVILILLGLAVASEKIYISSVTKTIASKESQLRNVTGLVSALTAQQDLDSLGNLYSQRVYLSKFFDAYIQANPATVSLSSLSIDNTNTVNINGSATTYAAVAQLTDSLASQTTPSGQSAFSDTNIQSVSRGANSVGFTLTATLSQGVTSGQ